VIFVIETLESALRQAIGNRERIRDLFVGHIRSRFLDQFVQEHLNGIAADPGHIVRRNAGQLNFTFINSPHFEYTVRLAPPFRSRPHGVKWLGERQLLGVKRGTVAVRQLFVPGHVNTFAKGTQIERMETVLVEPGAYLEADTANCILDIDEVRDPTVLEVLTIRDPTVHLLWTFDSRLAAQYAESSKMNSSRLQNIFDLARTMGRPVPPDVYDVVFSQGNAQEKLVAIESLLLAASERGFLELQSAIDSEDAALSRNAQELFDRMLGGNAA
jgi:hypothetical protein